MSYKDILSKYIKKSGMNLEEISHKCGKLGFKVHHTYIGKLRNGTRPPASNDINIVLSKVLGIEPEKLILAARNDKMESEKQETIKLFKTMYPEQDPNKLWNSIFEIPTPNIGEKMDLSDETLTWDGDTLGDEEKESVSEIVNLFLTMDSIDRSRAIELVKVLNDTKKDT